MADEKEYDENGDPIEPPIEEPIGGQDEPIEEKPGHPDPPD